MNMGDSLFNAIYKVYTFRPRLRRLLTWLTFHVGKMPQYHINLSPGDVGPYALLVADQTDVPRLAGMLENSKRLTEHREYLSYCGTLKGVKVLVISMGYASPPLAIGMEELILNGVETFLYIGTCRPLQSHLRSGEIILVEGAVREDGTSHQYVPPSFPAVPDPFIASCLLNACRKAEKPFHRGICLTRDVDVPLLDRQSQFINSFAESGTKIWERCGVLCTETCAATLFTVAQVLKRRAGCLLQVGEPPQSFSSELAKILLNGVDLMIQKDAG